MSKRVLITGGAGFIGFHLASQLSNQKKYHITILDNFERGGYDDKGLKKLSEKKNIHFIEGDVTNPRVFEKLNNLDYIYHFAAINGTENFYSIPDKVLKVGVMGTLNILDWFVKQEKGKLLFSSSSETYAGALNLLKDKFPIPTPEEVPLIIDDVKNVRWSYGAGKILGEVAMHSYAKAHNLEEFTIIRYHNIYGERMGFEHVIPQFIGRIEKKEDPFKIYGGLETRSFCYREDGIKATQLVMEDPRTNKQIIHIGRDDQEIKIIDLAKKLFEVAGVNPKIEIQPSPEGCVMRRCPDTTKLQQLGFSPKISLEEGLKKTYEWYKNKF